MAADAAAVRLGRLTSFGVSALHQLPLLLPTRWDDLSGYGASLRAAPPGERTLLIGTISGLRARVDHGPPRVVGTFTDRAGTSIKLVAFGSIGHLQRKIPTGALVAVQGVVRLFDTGMLLSAEDVIEAKWIGKLRPVYPGSKLLSPAGVRERIFAHFERALPLAAEFLRHALAPIGDAARLLSDFAGVTHTAASILREAHFPASLDSGLRAHDALMQAAALHRLIEVREIERARAAVPLLKLPTLDARLRALPFALTTDQSQSVQDLARDLASGRAMRRTLIGEAGSGKSAVYLSVIAALSDVGVRSAILLPNEPLARQVAAVLASFFPDLELAIACSKGSTGDLARAQVAIGTTALLHRASRQQFGFVVVDEEHRFGIDQKQALVAPQTHALLVSATCIPRSLALARYGVHDVSEIRSQHTDKDITTTQFEPSAKSMLFAAVRATIAAAGQVLVVYPLRDDPTARHSVTSAAPAWERAFPGRVRVLTGEDRAEDKTAALEALRVRRADVLVATTVVQEGIDLPDLRQVVIVCPDVHGLVALHQLRGRVARQGGAGRCDLYCPEPPSKTAAARLALFCATRDAFALAEADFWTRGPGDLAGSDKRQSGKDDTILPGKPLLPAHVEAVMDYL